MVKASGWQPLDRQFEPYLRARYFCGVAWDAVPDPMIGYIDSNFFQGTNEKKSFAASVNVQGGNVLLHTRITHCRPQGEMQTETL